MNQGNNMGKVICPYYGISFLWMVYRRFEAQRDKEESNHKSGGNMAGYSLFQSEADISKIKTEVLQASIEHIEKEIRKLKERREILMKELLKR